MYPAAGVAVKLTGVPLANDAEHVLPQLIPAGDVVTVPCPTFDTEAVKVFGAGVTVVTVTDADAVALPPVPVQVIEYTPVVVGVTDCDPDVALVPDHAPLAVQDVALVDDQVIAEADPCVTEVGLVEMVTVGSGVVGVVEVA